MKNGNWMARNPRFGNIHVENSIFSAKYKKQIEIERLNIKKRQQEKIKRKKEKRNSEE